MRNIDVTDGLTNNAEFISENRNDDLRKIKDIQTSGRLNYQYRIC